MDKKNMCSFFIFKNSIDEIPSLLDNISEFCEKHKIATDILSEVKLVIEEIVSNIIFYAYDDNGIHEIELKLELSKTMVEVQVTDEGRPFNPVLSGGKKAGEPLENYENGGMGLLIVRGIMEDIEYRFEDDKNILLMRKKLV